MQSPKLKICFHCHEKVYEYVDDRFGCDHCKTKWEFRDGGWQIVEEEKEKKRDDDRRNK